jgi:hypothetical protein
MNTFALARSSEVPGFREVTCACCLKVPSCYKIKLQAGMILLKVSETLIKLST